MLRLFVAIYPPSQTIRMLADELRGIEADGCRRVPSEQVHLTVLFLGRTRSEDVARICESVDRSCSGISAFSLTPSRLITLPQRGPARLIACETDAPAPLLEIRRRLALRLASRPRRDPGDRFRPHLTLCRFQGALARPRIDKQVCVPGFQVHEIVLVRSELTPRGAIHNRVHATALAEN